MKVLKYHTSRFWASMEEIEKPHWLVSKNNPKNYLYIVFHREPQLFLTY